MKGFKFWEQYINKSQTDLDNYKETKGYGLYSLRQCGEMQGDIKKMANINELAPVTPLFNGCEKAENKDDLLDKTISIEAYAEMKGEKEGETFGVIKYLINGKMQTVSINQMMLERLKEGVQKVGINAEESTTKELFLATPIEAVIVKRTSTKNGKTYYMFSDGKEEAKVE